MIKSLKTQVKARGGCKKAKKVLKKLVIKRKIIGGGRGTWTPKRYRKPTKKINFKRKRIGGRTGTWTPKRRGRSSSSSSSTTTTTTTSIETIEVVSYQITYYQQ